MSVRRGTVRGVGVPAHLVLAGLARRIPHDAVVVRQGEPSTSLYLMERGAMRLSCVTVDGRELVVGLLGSGDVFGEAALLGEPSPVEARTVGASIVVGYDADLLPLVIRERPFVGTELLRLVAARTHRTERALTEALTTDLASRIAARLRDLADQHGAKVDDGVRLTIPLTQDELARMVGASREAVNRSLRSLVARDLVRTERRTVVIPDLEALART